MWKTKSDLVESRNSKHKMSNILKRETSQPHYLDFQQPQGEKWDDLTSNTDTPDHGCLKASIWNKPGDDPRYVLRIGTSKIRSQSEEIKVKTFKDEEREKAQFKLFLKEVERRFNKSNMKDYSFIKSQKLGKLTNFTKEEVSLPSVNKKKSRKSTGQSRNHIAERYIELNNTLSKQRTHRNHNLSEIMRSSQNSSRNGNVNYSGGNFETNYKRKLRKTNIYKKPIDSANIYLKHSMNSGSFNKLKSFEKPLLKHLRSTQQNRFVVERKQINLQSKTRKKKSDSFRGMNKQISKCRKDFLGNFKNLKDSHLSSNSSSSRNLIKGLRRNKTGLPASFRSKNNISRNGNLISKSMNQSGNRKSKIYCFSELEKATQNCEG